MIRIYPGSDDNGGCDVASEDYKLLQNTCEPTIAL